MSKTAFAPARAVFPLVRLIMVLHDESFSLNIKSQKIASFDFAKLKIHLEIPMIKSCCSQSMSNWIYVRNSEKITPLIPNLVKCDRKSQCLKITEKVAFNIASEAIYVYILSGQKFIKNAEKRYIWRVFENLKFAFKHYQTCQFSQDKKLLENAKNSKFKIQNSKFKMRHFE